MSTNRGISPRALRSNRRLIGLVVACFFLGTGIVGAQQTASRAILVSQPRFQSGIARLPANDIAHFVAFYDVDGVSVEVLLAEPQRTADPAVSRWLPYACSFAPTEQYDGRRQSAQDLIRYATPDFDLYLVIPEAIPWACDFLQEYTDLLLFFAQADRKTARALESLATGAIAQATGIPVPEFPAFVEF